MKRIMAVAIVAMLAGCGGGGGSKNDGNPGEPNDSTGTATPAALGTPVVATISTVTDYDYYKITVPAGGATVNIQTFDQGGVACDAAGDTVDTWVDVFDASGTWLTFSDDSGLNFCEDFTVALPEGVAYVAVSGFPPYPFLYTVKIRIL